MRYGFYRAGTERSKVRALVLLFQMIFVPVLLGKTFATFTPARQFPSQMSEI